MNMLHARTLLVLVSLLFSGIVLFPSDGRAQREELLLSSRPPPEGQRCSISDREPPALGAIVDSTGLHSDLLDLARSEEGAEGSVLLSLAIDSTGSFARPPGIIENDLPDITAAMVVAFVQARAAPAAIDERRYARVKVTLDSVPHFRMGRHETCRPELANRDKVNRYLAALQRRIRESGRALLYVYVTANGRVTDMRVEESSGVQAVDSLALVLATNMRFHPARVDYIPVPVWVSIPVTFRGR